jgi:hypothetical protein
MKPFVVSSILFAAVTIACHAASRADTDGIGGDWRGESICTVHPSSCHDEHVIYHITEPDSAGKLQINADKIVDGKPEFMGTIDCTFDRQHSSIACTMKQGIWAFAVAGSNMTGTLKLPDGTLFRRISVHKQG